MTAAPVALLVGHGTPSAPERGEAFVAELAEALRPHLPHWQVRSATLAAREALPRATADLVPATPLLIAPHFMADGWFVRTALRRRLVAAVRGPFTLLPPFGLLPGLARLVARRAGEAAAATGLDIARTGLVLAGHGSPDDPRPGEVVRQLAERLARSGPFADVTVGFVDQAPFLDTALSVRGPALCLPFFASPGGHVRIDLPEAAARAGFAGPILPPIGADPEAVRLWAAALVREAEAPAMRRRVCT
jgi:sirohydrochlorin ferrochelatase